MLQDDQCSAVDECSPDLYNNYNHYMQEKAMRHSYPVEVERAISWNIVSWKG